MAVPGGVGVRAMGRLGAVLWLYLPPYFHEETYLLRVFQILRTFMGYVSYRGMIINFSEGEENLSAGYHACSA